MGKEERKKINNKNIIITIINEPAFVIWFFSKINKYITNITAHNRERDQAVTNIVGPEGIEPSTP